MSSPHTSLPLYSADRFVDREREANLIKELVRLRRDGVTDRPRTVVLYGERGGGKTWFSLHLKRTVLPSLEDVNITALLISLFHRSGGHSPEQDEWFGDTSSDAESVTRTIINWVAERLQVDTAPGADLGRLATWLARGVEQKFHEAVLVLILDSAFEASRL